MKNGWQSKKLGEVCITIQDGAHESPQKQFDAPAKGLFLYITSKNIRTNYLDLRNVSYVEREFHDKIYPRCKPLVGDVLLTKDGANTGNVCLNTIDQPFSLLSSVCLLKTNPSALEPAFLCYYLQSPDGLKSIIGQMSGAAIKRIILRDVKLATIPLPSLSEQQRIVGILDEAFEGIATAKANAERNLQNARALFESHLNSVFTQRGEGWVEKRLEEVAESISTGPFGTMLHKSDYVADGIPLVNPMNIVGSRIVPSNKMMVSEETRERLRSYVLKEGDVVIGRRGELGRCALVTQHEEGWLCGTGSFFVRLSDCMDGKFFVALFGSQQFRTRLEGSAIGATMSSLNHSILNDLRLPVPPVTVQRREMAKADELLFETQRLESIYQQKLAALEELKKSLLHQAFNGEL
jgi:type I restriction enzyme S subunit